MDGAPQVALGWATFGRQRFEIASSIEPIMTDVNPSHIPLDGGKGPALWGKHTLVSIVLTAAVMVFLAAYVDVHHLWQQLVDSNKVYLVIAGLSHYATYPIRGIRWKRCLKHLPLQCSSARFGLLVFFYNFVDNLVPAKLGDLYAAHLVRINCGVRRSAALGSLLFLRTLDSWIIFGMAAAVSWHLFADAIPRSVVWVLIVGCSFAVVGTTLMVVFVLFKRSVPRWLPETIRQMIKAFQAGMWPKPKQFFRISLHTIAIWLLESLWIFFLALAFNLQLSVANLIFLTMIPLIASAFPITPSGAGVVELTLFTCLRVIGVSSPLAVSLTVVNRFIDYWLHIALGALTWSIRKQIGLHTWREIPPGSFDSGGDGPGCIGQQISP
ncbi:MAG: hypothetical protein AMJ54_09045 [Deltaproteobacteria bacterium SG8_13]|nr:MAG: hypothetical protein AMJ54_09045 [Deltaproteobacteria bacterium SG8_13]